MNVLIFRSAQLVFLSLLPLPPTRSQPEAVGMSRTRLPRPPRGSGQYPASRTSRQHLLGGRCPAQGSLRGRGAEQSCRPLAARGGGLVRGRSGCLPCWPGGGCPTCPGGRLRPRAGCCRPWWFPSCGRAQRDRRQSSSVLPELCRGPPYAPSQGAFCCLACGHSLSRDTYLSETSSTSVGSRR